MKGPKVLGGIGCAGFCVSFLALAVSVVLPMVSDGRTSWKEAALGIVPGVVCTGISFLVFAGAFVWLLSAVGKGPAGAGKR